MINQKTEDNKSQVIELNFSKYAHIYDKHAQLQKLMADKLASFIPSNAPERILEIGCGTGMFTKYLLSIKVKKIFLNDVSSRMIECMETKLCLPPYSQIIIGNAELLKFQMVDMVAANAVFQWFKDPGGVLKRLNSYINPNGRLIFSTFGPSSLAELRKLGSLESPASLLSSSEWSQIIKEAGFTLDSFSKKTHKLFFSNTLALLKNLQQLGAAPRNMTSQRELRQLIKNYDDAYYSKQGVYANWELLFFSAKKNQ
jgi:malonyl-CoA O-methyltransferase